MDPSQFLARENEEEEHVNEEEGGGGPPILTSLGLTHINHVNPYSFLVSLLFGDLSKQLVPKSLLKIQLSFLLLVVG